MDLRGAGVPREHIHQTIHNVVAPINNNITVLPVPLSTTHQYDAHNHYLHPRARRSRRSAATRAQHPQTVHVHCLQLHNIRQRRHELLARSFVVSAALIQVFVRCSHPAQVRRQI